ncbi:MAG TPA: lipase maturation factor family protein [Candidatus Limnocylindrales bacterium]|nr:lipase maturation factor family protein [Candidatus Limnocylindrales bacterium]
MDAWRNILRWLFLPEQSTSERPGHLLPRWVFLRCLGVIYFSAFYSLLFQIKGLIGPTGILPAADYLKLIPQYYPGIQRFWFAPTLFWLSAGNGMLMLVTWLGIVASVALLLNLWPRLNLVVCFVCFLSFVAAAQDFSGYQSDGMLLEAGFLSLFFAPRGLRPGWGAASPPNRAARFLLLWEWFRIYFESGVVKLASGDYSWRHFTAMDDYYQNCPLPSWLGWYVQHLPHRFHAFTVGFTFVAELGLVWMLFLPRRWKIICFWIVTPFQAGIILTANYTFLNYLVLCLGFILLDDKYLARFVPPKWRETLPEVSESASSIAEGPETKVRRRSELIYLLLMGWALALVFYVSTAELLAMFRMATILPDEPIRLLEPFRIANRYGLFAVMTHQRYEVEFQGSNDGQNWTAYPFRYKPQDPMKAPSIYAPYQPRFEWNLWFASLGPWRQNEFVVQTEERLLRNDSTVLQLFSGNPFSKSPPQKMRVVLWQYWFTSMDEKRRTGAWWTRKLLGEYAPGLERNQQGEVVVTPASEGFGQRGR